MACVYHPDRETAAICSQCKADLCESCALRLEDVRIICHRCMVALSLHDVRSEAAERKLAQEARRLGLERRWRPTYLQVVLTVGVVLTLVLGGLGLYWNQPIPRQQIDLDPSSPVSLLSSLQTALELYAAAHGEQYPQSLYDLLPRFLADSAQNRRVLRQLTYVRNDREGYRLQIRENASIVGGGFMATAEGIRFPVEGQSR